MNYLHHLPYANIVGACGVVCLSHKNALNIGERFVRQKGSLIGDFCFTTLLN